MDFANLGTNVIKRASPADFRADGQGEYTSSDGLANAARRSQWFSEVDLLQRGWTAPLVIALLQGPDYVDRQTAPDDAGYCYNIGRVMRAEMTDAFADQARGEVERPLLATEMVLKRQAITSTGWRRVFPGDTQYHATIATALAPYNLAQRGWTLDLVETLLRGPDFMTMYQDRFSGLGLYDLLRVERAEKDPLFSAGSPHAIR